MQGRVYLGRYETIRLLGQGGMGKVYLSRHLELDEPVVVKVMHEHIAADPVFRERFKREMRLMARFKHPNAVLLHDASLEDPQGPCIVMEYLAGVGLDRLLAKNVRFHAMRVHRFLRQLCDVLQAAHDLGIVHRDLKPANLMVLDPDTPNERIKVMDFGLARMVERSPAAAAKETLRPEFAVGTPGYMAPEQVRGDAVDHRADLYSVGAILYQLLTGRLPFAGTTVMEVLMAQASDEIPTFAEIRITDIVPPGVEEVVRWSLALKPEDRPQTARELFERYDEAVTNAMRGLTAAPTPAMDEPADPAPAATPPAAAAVSETGSAADATVEQLEAFLPEQLAIFKLKAFVEEVGGKIVENAPGLIRVQMKVNRSALARSGKRKSLLSWLGLRPKYGTIDMELRMKKKDVKNQAVIQITVLLRPSGGGPVPDNPDWRARCNIITSALKAYLMSS